ncbi:hypothetical protein C1645_826098 [Glomus cerebriforme]|uniref:Uncharacterized protein n=1 Tax=Glomus cerebriforme TaxID=658196 RepID=A0A397SXP8_9GLOM|nr:hypothetical protein C1645_826098 [Glomus cerebriforme]
MSSHQLNTNSSQDSRNINQNLHSNKYRPIASKPSAQKLMILILVRPNSSESYSLMIASQATPMRNIVNNIVVELTTLLINAATSTIARSNNYYLFHNTNDNYQDHNDKENVLNLEEIKNSKNKKADNKS